MSVMRECFGEERVSEIVLWSFSFCLFHLVTAFFSFSLGMYQELFFSASFLLNYVLSFCLSVSFSIALHLHLSPCISIFIFPTLFPYLTHTSNVLLSLSHVHISSLSFSDTNFLSLLFLQSQCTHLSLSTLKNLRMWVCVFREDTECVYLICK